MTIGCLRMATGSLMMLAGPSERWTKRVGQRNGDILLFREYGWPGGHRLASIPRCRAVGTGTRLVPSSADAANRFGGGYATAVTQGIVNGTLSGLGGLGGGFLETNIKLGLRKGFPIPGGFPPPGFL